MSKNISWENGKFKKKTFFQKVQLTACRQGANAKCNKNARRYLLFNSFIAF